MSNVTIVVPFFHSVIHRRFIPPMNALGTPDDQDPDRNNQENSCYCLAKEGFKCFKSGLVNLGACKREDMSPPLALSMPHFYQVSSLSQNSNA